ncbi:hypothetical protein AR457_02535 [Streptomyces agglomeratus]|uniref:Uncharacterized protein n=1 Tax=Streptomyces agglomeratus TaxID=285458 RepID=A0A1E5P1V9_9ACTN|nr:hypothetical protein AS594_02635 [Streptomyces agglomeratus]OEJ43138.1 hypothetical protein AR457_02535 [Streptomyces agglomeratus]OEJ54942.1 hypothetical protein BGK72_33240 [Streptomyces agglomeratus]OEJ62313.1 hypothetical protein BGM19_34160 [Streptomyces agglomeratus]
MEGREVHHFDDVEKMAATSDLVVKAQVTDVQPGRWVGSKEDGGREQVREVTLHVEEVLHSARATKPQTVLVDEWGWDEEGRGYQLEGVTWTAKGDEGIYFLTQSEERGHWRLVNSQGRALVDGQQLDSAANEGDQLGERIESLTPQQLEKQVQKAARAVEAGDLKGVEEPAALADDAKE